ncbi:MAG: DUF4197 domain-containing protein [Thermodesulfobacteriota bacterium]
MKKCFASLCVLSVVFVWSGANSQALGASWWETGLNVLKAVNGESGGATTAINGPNVTEIDQAFRQALKMGSEQVVARVGVVDGFNLDPAIHIPLPPELVRIKTALAAVGMSYYVDDLELKLNRAAEYAAPRARGLFSQAISEMSFDDIMRIYEGPNDSATRYFQGKMSPGLRAEMHPIIESTMAQAGAVQAYDRVMGKYKALPFVPDVKANLEAHVVQRGIDGIFYYMAREEAAIRQDPARQTTALLKKVFAGQ